jgi:ATP-dependent Clp protease protease subunit
MATSTPLPPEHAYGIFCGDINTTNTQLLVKNLTLASNIGIKTVHMLFQSWGGYVGDGIFLYNLLKTFPVEVVLYNAGQIASAGVLAYMGARQRKTSPNAVFMIHHTTNNAQNAGADRLKVVAESLVLDDARTDALFRDNLQLPKQMWAQIASHDVNLSGADAIKYGLAQGIGEFSPPAGTKVFNALV